MMNRNFFPDAAGREMYELISVLYPVCRSMTGRGIRETLRILQGHIPLEVREIPTGTKVFDWTVPREWNIQDAYVKNSRGEKVIDFSHSNLHVVGYSSPVKKKMSLTELKEHLFTLPEHPDWIPYRTSFYREGWGFCLAHRDFEALEENEYEVCIEASLGEGHLTYGEYYLPGETSDEVLISCHICHPSLCNDNLSGVAVATFLAKHLSSSPRRYSYRFLFIPATIGAITWLALNEPRVFKIKHGLVLSCLGDSGPSTYKKTRRGNAEIDAAMIHVLKHTGEDHSVIDFTPDGYDERQYGSPAFNLPVGSLMRTPNHCFPEYHTSADNLDFIRPACLADSFFKCLSLFSVLENNRTYLNQNPKGEPHLGKRGLFGSGGSPRRRGDADMVLLWLLNFSDGDHSLLDIAERSGFPFADIKEGADTLVRFGLLKIAAPEGKP